jgi:phosphoesterase RecJ-like protein
VITSELASQVRQLIEAAHTIHIYTHSNPDGDAISSLAALDLVLSQWGKEVVCRCDTPLAPMYQWFDIELTDRQDLPLPDLIITVDFAKLSQLGLLNEVFVFDQQKIPLLNIDHHHMVNEKFGDINVVEDSCSTTCVLYNLFEQLNIEFNARLSNVLLYGIISDTSFFQRANTNLEALQVATNLTKFGATPSFVARKAYKSKSLSVLKLWGEAINSVKLYCGGQLSVTIITKEMFEKHDVDEFSANLTSLANFLTAIQTTRITVLIKERYDKISVSFRSDPISSLNEYYLETEDIDVSKIAGWFDGGGHLAASGCLIDGSIDEVEKLVVQACATVLGCEVTW